jgi:DNA-binding transcriptional regulator YhcF (GntR family)
MIPSKDQLVREELDRLVSAGQPGTRLPRIRDLMAEFNTSQRIVQRALAPLIDNGQIVARPGAGLRIADPPETMTYLGDCLILYRGSESRLARTLLIQLVARLRRKGRRVEMKGFRDETDAMGFLERQGRFRCCLLQTNFETVTVGFLASIREHADALVIDGVSVTGIDADVIGTNWREALSVGYRMLRAQGHERIGFLTSAHDARQIAMARREFLLLSEWQGPDPHPRLHMVPGLPGSYRREELVRALPAPEASRDASTALIVWGLVDGYLMDAALQEKALRPGVDVSLLLLGSVDVPSEHVSQFDVVGNSDTEKLNLFDHVVTARIEGSLEAPRTHYLPIYTQVNGSIRLQDATSPE